MGSHAEAPELALAIPTPDERTATWTATHPHWGAALDLDVYHRREHFLTTVPQSRNGGITHWILTDPSAAPGARPVLSSCESIRKRCLVASPDGTVREGVTHGITSVFTEPRYRGHGYASKMMKLLGPHLATWQGRALGPPDSFLALGRLRPRAASEPSTRGRLLHPLLRHWQDLLRQERLARLRVGPPVLPASRVGFSRHRDEAVALAVLCSLDEQLLRAQLARPTSDSRTRVALIPDLDATLWHLMREDFMTTHIFGKTPTIRGAVFGAPGNRVWAVWTRGYYGGLKKPEGNTFHILRVSIEDEDAADEAYLAEAMSAIIGLAREEAAAWKVNNVELWNPTAKLRAAIDRAGLPHEFVDRQDTSIACLMWYGHGEVDWVANEKFGWC
ncbi:lysine acetyltransferase [Verticillium dahliae VdLs.17]|uniref:Lysine acetyltransferase n=1 Tax=Verticillium dahliae (strain VdLs.17 / ATCC MYA-4575 / FGSC 10137) TaxID=498257 RepID=G2WR11_VERDV|nr:lysine acetyltransferase [Verticillium dahliae VdLs.17]EGY14110.1 lysine acetyltransferase [Verticillium dahliae VdLs.17]